MKDEVPETTATLGMWDWELPKRRGPTIDPK